MSLISYIEKLRTKPETERKKISIGVAFAVTGIIFAIWAFTIISSVSQGTSTHTVTGSDNSTSTYGELKSRWGALIDGVSDLFSGDTVTPTENIDEEPLYFDALEGIPADVVEIDATDATTTPTE